MAKFDSKSFNPQAFGAYVDRIPNTKKTELAKSGAIGSNATARNALATQTGSLYARVPYFGRISGATSQNNDGDTNISSTGTTTYEQGFVTASRMDSWTERSFSANITAGVDFMDNVAAQLADYKFEVKQAMALAILKGIYSMDTTAGTVAAAAADEFISKHTYDISGAGTPTVGAGTLNSAIQKACGDNKNVFKLAFMHSQVATNLENLRLLEYLKYTDKDGVQRDLPIASWNGRTVIVDDGVPTEQVVTTAGVSTITVTHAPKAGDKFTVCGTEFTWVANGETPAADEVEMASTNNVNNSAAAIQSKLNGITTGEIAKFTWTVSSAVVTATQKLTAPDAVFGASVSADAEDFTATIAKNTTEPVISTKYTTYVLGEGAIILDEIGDNYPYEMSRDPKTNGGQDTLYTRDRYICGAQGISFEKNASITASASNSDLETGTNWNIINDGTKAIPTKSIAIAKIVSLG
jgi:hypothetical protein